MPVIVHMFRTIFKENVWTPFFRYFQLVNYHCLSIPIIDRWVHTFIDILNIKGLPVKFMFLVCTLA